MVLRRNMTWCVPVELNLETTFLGTENECILLGQHLFPSNYNIMLSVPTAYMYEICKGFLGQINLFNFWHVFLLSIFVLQMYDYFKLLLLLTFTIPQSVLYLYIRKSK